MFEGKKGQAASIPMRDLRSLRPGDIAPKEGFMQLLMRGTGHIGKSVLPKGTSVAASVAKNALGWIPGGFGLGIGQHVANVVAQSGYGLKPLMVAIAFDVFAYFTGDYNPLFGNFFQAVAAYLLMRQIGYDKFLAFLMRMKIFVLIYILLLGAFPQILQFFPEGHAWIFLTIGNSLFPIYSMYLIFTGFVFNRAGGLIAQVVYTLAFFSLLFLAYDHLQDEVAEKFEEAGMDYNDVIPEGQQLVFKNFITALWRSSTTTGVEVGRAILNIPHAVVNFGSEAVDTATEGILPSEEKKEQPKMGILLKKHSTPVSAYNDKTTANVYAVIENPLEDRNFITITGASCIYESSKGKEDGTITFPGGNTIDDLKRGINLFFDRPLEIACELPETRTSGNVDFFVDYDFESNVKFRTYFMKDTLLQDLLLRKQDLNYYMGVQPEDRDPRPQADNGPARFAIAPADLANVPFGIRDKKTILFTFTVQNNPLFQGKIGEVHNIVISLPNGVSFVDEEACVFKALDKEKNSYEIKPEKMQKEKLEFTNIKSEKREFKCNMLINSVNEVLQLSRRAPEGTAFSRVEFDIDVDFTYQTTFKVNLAGGPVS